jgi:parallel beta-helix repeat protein
VRRRPFVIPLLGTVIAGVAVVAAATGGPEGPAAPRSTSVARSAERLPPAPGPPRAYYVDDRDGHDTDAGTSPEAAWRTLAKASQAPLPPGSRLLLRRGGRWSESLVLAASGTAEDPVTVTAYGDGDPPVITGARTCVEVTGSHTLVSELVVKDCSWAGIAIAGRSNRLERNVITGNAAGVYLRPGATGNLVLRNEIRDNNRMSVLTPDHQNDDSGAFGVLIRGDGNEVAYNTITGSDAFSYDYGRDGAAVEIFGGQDNHIHHNVALENTAFTELGDPRTAGNTFAYNLVRSSVEDAVFLITRGPETSRGPVLRTRAVHNTVFLTGRSSQGFVCHAGCRPEVLTMRNNVIVAVWKAGYADAPFDEDADLFHGAPLRFTPGPRTLVADPGFVDPVAGDFHLAPSSPAIDRGEAAGETEDLDGARVPQDGNSDGVLAPDLGAYERQGSQPSASTPD